MIGTNMSKVEQLEYKGIRYLLFYPKNYIEGKKYPVLFHLHGAGSRGDSFEYLEGSSATVIGIINKGDSPLSDGFVIFPQCQTDTWFDRFSELLDLVRYSYKQPFVDKTNFNGSGVSMGGYAIYQVMEVLPECFHKAIICCGGGMYWNAERLRKIKFRIFHGEQDTLVYPEESIRMYEALKDVNADASLTLYTNCTHNCWDRTYPNYENLKWLFE